MRLLTLFLLLFVSLGANLLEVRADEPLPMWLQEASKRATPSFNVEEVPALVLHDEQNVVLNAEGNLTITTNYAMRVLRREGRGYATAQIPYLQSSSKVRDLKAWLIRPNGTVKFFNKDSIVDRISDPDDIYNEYREKFINASDESDAGSIFGYQVIVEERPLFTQDIWAF